MYCLFLEVFRNPSIEVTSRKTICNIIVLFFCKFFKQTSTITKKSNEEKQSQAFKVSQYKSKYSDGICFAQKKYIIKIIHTVLALYFCLNDTEKLGLDRLTTHIIENFFGLNRMRCRGNNSFDRVLHFFIEGAFDLHLINEYNLGKKISQRDNIGGTKFKPDKWTIKFENQIDPLDFVESFYQYGTNEENLDTTDQKIIDDKVFEYILFLKKFHDELINVDAYKPILHEPGNASGKLIDFR